MIYSYSQTRNFIVGAGVILNTLSKPTPIISLITKNFKLFLTEPVSRDMKKVKNILNFNFNRMCYIVNRQKISVLFMRYFKFIEW